MTQRHEWEGTAASQLHTGSCNSYNENIIFKWGDLFFLQLLRTAIGMSSVVMWATLYYTYHELHKIIPIHGMFLLYQKIIYDILGIWIDVIPSAVTLAISEHYHGIPNNKNCHWQWTFWTSLSQSKKVQSSQKPTKKRWISIFNYPSHWPILNAVLKA